MQQLSSLESNKLVAYFTDRVNGGQSIYHARLTDDDDKLVHTAAAGHTDRRVT